MIAASLALLHDNGVLTNPTVFEGRLFVTGDGFGVYDASTGDTLWENTGIQFRTDANITNPGWLTTWPFEGNRLFGTGGVVMVGFFVYRLDTGAVLWSRSCSTLVNGSPIVYENQVIMRNGTEEETTVFSFAENSGVVVHSLELQY